MSAVIVTAKFADALVCEAPDAGLIATFLAGGRVRVESPAGDTPEGLAEEMWEHSYRFGITKVEPDIELRMEER